MYHEKGFLKIVKMIFPEKKRKSLKDLRSFRILIIYRANQLVL